MASMLSFAEAFDYDLETMEDLALAALDVAERVTAACNRDGRVHQEPRLAKLRLARE